jgi:hypothetical protein
MIWYVHLRGVKRLGVVQELFHETTAVWWNKTSLRQALICVWTHSSCLDILHLQNEMKGEDDLAPLTVYQRLSCLNLEQPWNNLGTTCQGPHTIGTYASVACASSTCGWWACPGAKCSAGSLDSRHISKRLCRESNVFCFFYYCNLLYLLLLFNLFESCSLILRIGFRRHMYADFFLRFVDAVSREVSDAWPKRSAAYCVCQSVCC